MSSVAISTADRQPESQRDWLATARPRAGLVTWLQRGLLGLLALAHVVYPFWLGRESDLLRDSLILAQATVLLVLLTHGGLGWKANLLALLVAAAPATRWYLDYVFYTPYLLSYAGTWLAPYLVCCTITLVGLRLYGYRGTWQERVSEPRPLQVSILSLLILMTVVAGLLTASSMIRKFESAGEDPDQRLWLSVLTDGVVASVVTALMVLCIGRAGSPVLRSLLLLGTMLFLGGCSIYAFQMEDYWHLSALTMIAWTGVSVGTFLIWRVCGWQVVLPRRDFEDSLKRVQSGRGA